MAKSPRTGENRGRRAADRRRVVEEPLSPQAAPSTADDNSAGGDRRAAVAVPTNGITRDAIARRAYEIYTARGGTHGYDIEDWLQAERELLGNK